MNYEALKCCTLCPRECKTDRISGKFGYCMANNKIHIARAALHFWEEPCISGKNGSGAVFFSGCPLKCIYCQNYQISSEFVGKEITIAELSDIFLNLQYEGANNINLVTPTHYTLHIIDALQRAKMNGLKIPVVYNCGGYEKVETLRMLDGLVDIYLPDFKYFDNELAIKYSKAKNYLNIAGNAISEMISQTGGKNIFNNKGIMQKGVIVRHLVLPGNLDNSKKVISYLHTMFKDKIYLSIMNQYTPVKKHKHLTELNTVLTDKDYNEIIEFAINIGVENAFIQEGGTADESFIPPFEI